MNLSKEAIRNPLCFTKSPEEPAGKTVAGFTNEEEVAVGLKDVVPFLLESTLIERGATHTKAPNFQAHIEVSDRLVTGQNPASAHGVGVEMVKLILAQRQN
jgi:putative intracellular protease/amidase